MSRHRTFLCCASNWPSFLMLYYTEEDYNAFCLAYMFTYRDFEGGTLGLAWTGDLKNAGGVCEKNGVSSSCSVSLLSGVRYSTWIRSNKCLLGLIIFFLSALPREFEKFEYGHCDATELRQTRPTRRFSRHIGSRNWPQFRIAGTRCCCCCYSLYSPSQYLYLIFFGFPKKTFCVTARSGK